MADIKISDMMRMQMNLWEQHKDTWSPMEAKFGRNFILWMMEEMGECIAIIKKKGDYCLAVKENHKTFYEDIIPFLS